MEKNTQIYHPQQPNWQKTCDDCFKRMLVNWQIEIRILKIIDFLFIGSLFEVFFKGFTCFFGPFFLQIKMTLHNCHIELFGIFHFLVRVSRPDQVSSGLVFPKLNLAFRERELLLIIRMSHKVDAKIVCGFNELKSHLLYRDL